MDKITPYKLFNTKFTIGSNAFLTRAQPFHVNVGDTVRDSLLVRKEEFVQDNKAN